MSDSLRSPIESDFSNSEVKKPNRKGLQVGLRTIFLLMAAIAVWTAYLNNRRNNILLESRVAAMRSLAHELMVDDLGQIAVVKMEELWYDDNRWEIYLPSGQYRLSLATHEIDQQGFAPAAKSKLLSSGKHRIELSRQRDGDKSQVVISCDGVKFLEIEESKEWDPASGSVGGGGYSQNTQLAADEPVVLYRRRFSRAGATGQVTTPTGPTKGIMLWIERVAGS